MRKIVLFGIGALGGALLTGIAVLLLTPDSGDAMRRQAREQFDDLMDDATVAAEDRRKELEAELDALIHS